MQGWISLHRKMLQSDIFQNEKMFKIFMYCLMKASHKDRKQRIGMQVVELVKGQFVFGRKVAAVELNMNESTVYQYMKILEEDDVITIESNNKFSVVSVVNWCFYQDNSNNVTTKEQQNNNRITTKEQQNNTNNNVKNVKNVNKDVSSFPKEQEIFDYYISKDIIKHKQLTPSVRSKITTALKKRSLEELKQIIDNYATVYKGSQYYFNTMYSLEKILRPKDLNQFSNEEKPLYNFLTDKKTREQSKPKPIEVESVIEKWRI